MFLRICIPRVTLKHTRNFTSSIIRSYPKIPKIEASRVIKSEELHNDIGTGEDSAYSELLEYANTNKEPIHQTAEGLKPTALKSVKATETITISNTQVEGVVGDKHQVQVGQQTLQTEQDEQTQEQSPKIPKPKRETKEQKLIRKLREKDAEYTPKPKAEWVKRDESLAKRYGTWNPTRKMSHQQMNDIRSLSAQMPNLRTVDLANHYNISPEAIRRILKSQWVPNAKEEERLLSKISQKKAERVVAKQEMIEELEMLKKKRGYARSVDLGNMGISKHSKEHEPSQSSSTSKYSSKFTSNDGKINYDSNSNHGYYNKYKKKSKRPQTEHARKPYIRSAGDLID